MRSHHALISLLASALAGQAFSTFEAPPTRPLGLAADGTRLYALHPASHRLVLFDLTDPRAPRPLDAFFAGLEPVALTAHGDEVWVVDWLADAVHVVSLRQRAIVRSIRCGDEPTDVAFAGSPERAFVAVAGAGCVAVLDPPTGALLARVEVFGDRPRALVVGPRGDTVWVVAHRSGNGTTIVPAEAVPPQAEATDPALPPPPRQGLIVRSDDPQWRDITGAPVADRDLFELDARTFAVRRHVTGVGTTLFDATLDPHGGALWVANTEADNRRRFEPELRGRAVHHRVSRVALDDLRVAIFDLHPESSPPEAALAQPTDLCWSPRGDALFVAAFGSDRLGVLTPDGDVTARIDVSFGAASPRAKRGPRALVHHPHADLLYVWQQLAGRLAVVDAERRAPLLEVPFGPDPTPATLRQGRGFLYDARLSSTGTMSCAVCHVDAETDGLAWDLGDPGGAMQRVDNRGILDLQMHPMKGPLRTQTLRGLTPDTRPFHHRGDRATLAAFNPSFATLLGGTPLADDDLALFVGFLEAIAFPPNPNQNLDRTYPDSPAGASARDGLALFNEHLFAGPLTCKVCHRLPTGTNGVIVPGQLLHGDAQAFKTAALRDVYRRQGKAVQNGLRRAGFGLMHDGATDSVDALLHRPFFRELGDDADKRAALARFVLAFDTGTAPSVGFALTLSAGRTVTEAEQRDLEVIEAAATRRDCDLVARGTWRDGARAFVWAANAAAYQDIASGAQALARGTLLEAVGRGEATLTFLGTPPGRGADVAGAGR